MAPRDPFKFPGMGGRMENFMKALKRADRPPHLGVTQGGSSRKNAGAVPAATDGLFRPEPPKRKRKKAR